jgi:hypothetical protein
MMNRSGSPSRVHGYAEGLGQSGDIQNRRQPARHCQIRLNQVGEPFGNERHERGSALEMLACGDRGAAGLGKFPVSGHVRSRQRLFDEENVVGANFTLPAALPPLTRARPGPVSCRKM